MGHNQGRHISVQRWHQYYDVHVAPDLDGMRALARAVFMWDKYQPQYTTVIEGSCNPGEKISHLHLEHHYCKICDIPLRGYENAYGYCVYCMDEYDGLRRSIPEKMAAKHQLEPSDHPRRERLSKCGIHKLSWMTSGQGRFLGIECGIRRDSPRLRRYTMSWYNTTCPRCLENIPAPAPRADSPSLQPIGETLRRLQVGGSDA